MTDDNEIYELAQKMAKAVSTGDYESLRHLYSPSATLWFNYSNETRLIEDHLARASAMSDMFSKVSYENLRITTFEGGYIQRHKLVATTHDGKVITIPTCYVYEVKDGRVTHREEYIDFEPFRMLSK